MDQETDRIVRKAKYIARLKQLEAQGYKTSIQYNYKTSEELLATEVATGEILVKRNYKIQAGRAALMTVVNGTEWGAGILKLTKPSFVPQAIVPELDGWSQQVYSEQQRYDDPLERAYDMYMAPYVEANPLLQIIFMLASSALMFHITKKFSMIAENAIMGAVNNNPSVMEALASAMKQQQQQKNGMQAQSADTPLPSMVAPQVRADRERSEVINDHFRNLNGLSSKDFNLDFRQSPSRGRNDISDDFSGAQLTFNEL
jgi:hypothetical protein